MESIRLPGSYYGSDDLGEHSQPGDREKLIVMYTQADQQRRINVSGSFNVSVIIPSYHPPQPPN